MANHLALGLAVAALGGAGVRVASLAAPSGLERALAAVPLAAASAVLCALGLGLVGLGTEPVALLVAALGAWVAARYALPAPVRSPSAELRAWWRARSAGQRAVVGALSAFALAWVAWMLRYPELGDDGLHYHLPEVLAWVHDGHPGSLRAVLPLNPVESYPLTTEVILSWLAGLARSFTVVGIYSAAMGALLGLSAWTGLRSLDVPPAAAGLATAALVSSPLCVIQLNGAYTDLPAAAWVTCAGALCAGALRRPALLAPGVVAAGLAAGTKTTALIPALAVPLLAAWACERRAPGTLRRLAVPLSAATLAALVVGATWYVRNLILHGSPLWPVVGLPWGDPVPPFFDHFDDRFVARPVETLDGRLGDYYDALAGDLVILAALPVVALLARARAVTAAAAAAGVLLAAWACAPFTGVADDPVYVPVAVTTARYLLPTVVAVTLAVALGARAGGLAGRAAMALLALALALNVIENASVGFPFVPSLATTAIALAAGALVGALAGGAAARALPRGLAAGAAVVAAGALLSVAASGYADRHANTVHPDAELVRWFVAQPGFSKGSAPIAQAPTTLGILAGDRLRHPIPRLRPGTSCRRLRERAREGWVVMVDAPFASLQRQTARMEACLLADGPPVFTTTGYRVYGGPGGTG